MGFFTNLNTLKTSMLSFGTAFNTAVQSKRHTSSLSDNTNLVNGLNQTDLVSNMKSSMSTHIAMQDNDQVSLEALNVYSKDYINENIGTCVPLTSMPFSRYGDATVMPAEVKGSFEGATGTGAPIYVALGIEDDGTVVFLRGGTDGGTTGVYYAYCKGALNLALNYPVKSTRKYKPPFYPNDCEARVVSKSSEDVIICRTFSTISGTWDYSISLTGGTMEDNNHTGCFIKDADWPVMSYGQIEPVLGKDYLYLIQPYSEDPNKPVTIRIWQISVNDIKAGGFVTPTRVTGWSTTGFKKTVSNTDIWLADTWFGYDASVDCIFYLTDTTNLTYWGMASNSQFTYSGISEDNTKIRIRCNADNWFSNYVYGGEIRPMTVISIVVDLVNKTVTLDPGQVGPVVISLYDNGYPYVAGGNIVKNFNALEVAWPGGNSYSSYYYHSSGYLLSHNGQNQVDYGYYLGIGKLRDGALTKFDAVRQDREFDQASIITYFPDYGSAIGGKILCGNPLPNNYFLLSCGGRNNNQGAYNENYVRFKLGAAGYSYKSITYGTLPGFAPTSDRNFVTDLGFNTDNFRYSISYVDDTQVKLSGSYYVENYCHDSFTWLNENASPYNPTPTHVNADVFGSIRSQLFSKMGIEPSTVANSYVEFVLPLEGVKGFATLVWYNTSQQLFIAIANISITSGQIDGTISGINVDSYFKSGVILTGIKYFSVDNSYQISNMVIYKGSYGYAVGYNPKVYLTWTVTGGGLAICFLADLTTGLVDFSTVKAEMSYTTSTSLRYTALSGYGFGYFGSADNLTKAVFTPFIQTREGFINRTIGSNSYVLCGQQVASGWVVYFTSEVSILMNGVYDTIKPVNFDLTNITADPSNKTFYVYVIRNADKTFSYQISETSLTETETRMNIGTIETGNTSINTISVNKTSRLGNHLISTTNDKLITWG